jgi:hypothetical protein
VTLCWKEHGTLNKHKQDSEPQIASGSQLRKARKRWNKNVRRSRRVCQAPMAPGNAKSNPATVTSLADLWSQNDTPAPSAPRVGSHSVTSSPDPIAMSGDDQEIVILKHIPPSSSQVCARLEPVARIGPPTHSKPSLKAKSRSSTPKSATTTGADKLPDKSRKLKPNYAVVIPSPIKRPIPVGKGAPRSDASHSQQPTPAGTPVPKYTERLKERTNGMTPQPLATHTPQPVPIRLTRSTESIPEYAPRCEGLTARDIDALLGAVPVPFDFSLSHHRHSATRDDGETDGSDEETSSLWWHNPIFEARAKADIRRTLDALLPADPAQDPPLAGSGDDAGVWRVEVLSRQPGARMWAERLEDAF